MTLLEPIAAVPPQQIWTGVVARAVEGDRLTLAVVELAPGSTVPEHHHANEQLGICLTGSLTFRIGDETRTFGPGGTWRIPSNTPHEVVTGPEGAVVIDVFSPVREDWGKVPKESPRTPLWP